MKTISNLLTIVFLGVFLVSCTEQAPTTYLDESAFEGTPQVLSKIEDGPEFSGIVHRGQTDFAYTWVDPKNETRVTIGFDVLEYCAGIEDFDIVWFKDVWTPSGRPLVTSTQGDDLRTQVWSFMDFDCTLFNSMEPLASGVSDLVHTDNDLFGAQPDDKNTNSWGFHAHGTLMRPDGTYADFSGHDHLLWGNHQQFKENTRIVLD